MPKLPININEVHNVVTNMNPVTMKGEPFVIVNSISDNLIIFSTSTSLEHLCNSSKVYLDGTFEFCPKFFYHLFKLHGFFERIICAIGMVSLKR